MLMEIIAKIQLQPLLLLTNLSRQLNVNSISFRPMSPNANLSSSVTRASSNVYSIMPIIRTTCVTVTAVAALFFTRCSVLTAIAAPLETSSVETSEMKEDQESAKMDDEMTLEDRLGRNPKDKDALRLLMEMRIKSRKLSEAIEVLDRLIELEPDEEEWPLLKAQIHSYNGDLKAARRGYEEILNKDPFRVEAYHGLLMAESESGNPLRILVKRIEAAMEKCRKERRNSDLRDFKLLLAQVSVMEERYGDALKLYEELVKEEPRDFRPYLCQGIIYTLMHDKNSAEKKFDQFKRLVPKNHPYREYFFDNMFATKFFFEKLERDTAMSDN